MRNLFRIAVVALVGVIGLSVGPQPANAANTIRIKVDDQPITSYDISQRAALLRITGAGGGEKAAIEELIDELKANYTIIIVTHSMQQAARVSQRTAFFHLGILVEAAPTEQIFTNPRDKRTQDYITGRFG